MDAVRLALYFDVPFGVLSLKNLALRGIELVKVVFPDVNVPEKEWSHALKAKFRKHGTNPCKQNLSGAIFIRGEVAKSVKQIKESTTLYDGSSCY
jgi:hypothetical protein